MTSVLNFTLNMNYFGILHHFNVSLETRTFLSRFIRTLFIWKLAISKISLIFEPLFNIVLAVLAVWVRAGIQEFCHGGVKKEKVTHLLWAQSKHKWI